MSLSDISTGQSAVKSNPTSHQHNDGSAVTQFKSGHWHILQNKLPPRLASPRHARNLAPRATLPRHRLSGFLQPLAVAVESNSN